MEPGNDVNKQRIIIILLIGVIIAVFIDEIIDKKCIIKWLIYDTIDIIIYLTIDEIIDVVSL